MNIHDLQAGLPRDGKLIWLGVRPARDQPMRVVDSVRLVADRGIEGDRGARRAGGQRQVTLLQQEHLPVLGALLDGKPIDPALLRRNLLVAGINLLALRTRRFSIGDAVLEGTGYCHPCSRMERALGAGGYNAMRGHGGITARVLAGATIHRGDIVRSLD